MDFPSFPLPLEAKFSAERGEENTNKDCAMIALGKNAQRETLLHDSFFHAYFVLIFCELYLRKLNIRF